MNSSITYKELKKIVSWGIFNRKMKNNGCDTTELESHKITKAVHGGIYIGSPGKDIYYMFPYLTKEQMKEIAKIINEKFPKKPPENYSNVAAFIRFIYGQFEKQGILRSEKDFERMKKEKPDWSISREFLWYLFEELRKDNNYYGLTMLHEMEGHRCGDEALIYENKKKLEQMEINYWLCIEFAKKCDSYKHLFSIDYWAGEYFKKFGDEKKALEHYKKAIINSKKYYYKYFPNGEQYYKERLLKSLWLFKKEDNKFYNKYKKIKFLGINYEKYIRFL